MQRFFEVDALRGIAVIAMVCFHTLFDLNFFAGYDFNLQDGALFALGRFAAIAFVFLAGVSLTLSYNRARKLLNGWRVFQKFFVRGVKILILGLLITAVTFFLFPQEFIVFGVLHLIGVSVIFAFPFIPRKRLALFSGVLLIFAGLILQGLYFDFNYLLWLGFKPAAFYTFDYFPLLPWFGVVLLGIFAGNLFYPHGKRGFSLPDLSSAQPFSFLAALGRKSLLIYFLHQPVLVAAVLLFAA
ncbi:MAG: heparan-alpha-glucosaminide N-acetyltransferase [Candidatus Diapherotrites archaeon]|nr:heparan-alpha-glucosaminide N-acetyltransferase [Candidatus Diapherotrites archaeon]